MVRATSSGSGSVSCAATASPGGCEPGRRRCRRRPDAGCEVMSEVDRDLGRAPVLCGGAVLGLVLLRVLPDAEASEDLLLDLDGEFRVVLEELAGLLLALTELIPLVGEPGPGL